MLDYCCLDVNYVKAIDKLFESAIAIFGQIYSFRIVHAAKQRSLMFECDED